MSDPAQKWRLLANFLLYLLPFLAGALFLGTVFLKGDRIFARVYFADMVGAGLGGLVFLGMMFLIPPEDLIVVPLGARLRRWPRLVRLARARPLGRHRRDARLCGAGRGGACMVARRRSGCASSRCRTTRASATPASSPTAIRFYRSYSPFGDLEVYGSSYLHFAPGLSDNAAFNLPTMPANAYLGLYIDGEGPTAIIRNLPPEDTAYFGFLPMAYPYVIAKNPDTFVIQFGGGTSRPRWRCGKGSKSVTVSESNPTVLSAFRTDPTLRDFTGDLIHDPRVTVVDYDGRLYLAGHPDSYDVIDLSLADSAGLSAPGGFAIVENTPMRARR